MGSIEEAQSYLKRNTPEPEALQLIPEAMARKYSAVPLTVENHVLRVAMVNKPYTKSRQYDKHWTLFRNGW